MKKPNNKAKGGNARAEKLSPEERKTIASNAAKARWNNIQTKLPEITTKNQIDFGLLSLRDAIALSVLQGLYSNIDKATEHVVTTMSASMPLMEGFTRIAYTQADEVIRLRSL